MRARCLCSRSHRGQQWVRSSRAPYRLATALIDRSRQDMNVLPVFQVLVRPPSGQPKFGPFRRRLCEDEAGSSEAAIVPLNTSDVHAHDEPPRFSITPNRMFTSGNVRPSIQCLCLCLCLRQIRDTNSAQILVETSANGWGGQNWPEENTLESRCGGEGDCHISPGNPHGY